MYHEIRTYKHPGTRLFAAVFLFLAAAVLFLPMQCEAREAIRVKVEVIGDWRINRDVVDYLSGYLNSIKDVEVVEDDPRFYIHVIARSISTNKGRRLGYVMATASSEILEAVVNGSYPHVFTDYNGLWMETGPDLRALCEQCAVAIDSGVFDKLREEDVDER